MMPPRKTSTGLLAVGVRPVVLLLTELAGENLVRGLLYGSARLGDDLQDCLVRSPGHQVGARVSAELPLGGVGLLALITDGVYPRWESEPFGVGTFLVPPDTSWVVDAWHDIHLLGM
jgi:hypothetical protein